MRDQIVGALFTAGTLFLAIPSVLELVDQVRKKRHANRLRRDTELVQKYMDRLFEGGLALVNFNHYCDILSLSDYSRQIWESELETSAEVQAWNQLRSTLYQQTRRHLEGQVQKHVVSLEASR